MCHQKRSKTAGIPTDLTVEEMTVGRNGVARMQDALITDKASCRMLGLTLKNDLSWDKHLNQGKKALLPALRRQIGCIHRIGKQMGKKARLQLVNCLVISRLSYMITVWGNTNPTQIRKAQVVQNSAARLVTQLPKTTRQAVLLQECGWLNVKDLAEYHSLCQFWKILRWKVPYYMADKIHLENNDVVRTTNPRLQLTASSFRWNTTQNWNKLPSYIRSEVSLNRFKKSLKTWLRDRNKDNTAQPPD